MDLTGYRYAKEKEAAAYLHSISYEWTDIYVFDITSVDHENKEKKEVALKKFKALFNSEHKMALWNSILEFGCFNFSMLERKDYTNEEWDFLMKAQEVSQNISDRYLRIQRENINNEIETKRLMLVSPNYTFYAKLFKFFEENPKEFILYSKLEFDDYYFQTKFRAHINNMFTITTKNSGEFVGIVALHETSDFAHLYNLRMFVLPEYRNNGYATEACEAFIKNAFSGNLVELKETAWVGIKNNQTVNVELIEIEFSADNIAAQKVVKKLGFAFNGIAKRGWRIDFLEQYTDLVIYSLEKENYND